jgi:hypothetical protein
MLSNYLPLLPAKLTIEGRVLKPPKSIRTNIHKGSEARNGMVHAAVASRERSELDQLNRPRVTTVEVKPIEQVAD